MPVHRAAEQQKEKKAAADIHTYIGTLVGSDAVERVSVNGDTLVVKCSTGTAAHRARMYTHDIQEKTKKKRIFFLS